MSSKYNNHPHATSTATTTTTNSAQSTKSNSRPHQRQVNNNGSTVFGFKSATPTLTTSLASYHPYPGLVSRANLDIIGDLDDMTKSWTSEEWDHHRRLVQFWREQNGNKITATFQPAPQDERASDSDNIIVSCIYWRKRNDYFITSVDCIYLLESLMDIKFSVEEKNRIRRNLEGFRPLTVSKCKAESADFFKIIMDFPNPKPRNIEKDVKVFPWKALPFALKKVVAKYTASSCNNVGNQSQKTQQQQQQSESMPSSDTASMLHTTATENTSPSVVASARDTPFYQQQQQQSSNSDHPSMASNYSAQPYSHEMDEPAHCNQQSDSNLNNPSTSTSTSNAISATAEITTNADSATISTVEPTSTSKTISNTSTSSPKNNENETSLEKPENCTSD